MKSVKEVGFFGLKRVVRLLYAIGAEKLLRKVPGALPAYRLAYRSLRPEGEVVATVLGRKMYVDPRDMGAGARLITVGTTQPMETDLFRSLLRPGAVAVDIGANIGFYTLLAAELVGEQGKVIAFEPVPRNLALLRKSIEANGYRNITVVPMAVSNKRGTATLLLDNVNWGCNRITGVEQVGESIQVETVTLDEFFAESGTTVDLIKIDAEGAEVAILEGSHEFLARNPDIVILTEYNPKLLRAFGTPPGGYLRELAACGFELFCLDEVRQERTPLFADAIDPFTEHLCSQPGGSDFVNLLCLRGRSASAWHASVPDARSGRAKLLVS